MGFMCLSTWARVAHMCTSEIRKVDSEFTKKMRGDTQHCGIFNHFWPTHMLVLSRPCHCVLHQLLTGLQTALGARACSFPLRLQCVGLRQSWGKYSLGTCTRAGQIASIGWVASTHANKHTWMCTGKHSAGLISNPALAHLSCNVATPVEYSCRHSGWVVGTGMWNTYRSPIKKITVHENK